MAKAATKTPTDKKKRSRKPGPRRAVSKSVRIKTALALRQVRDAKRELESKTPGARAAWRELHNVESRLSRLQ